MNLGCPKILLWLSIPLFLQAGQVGSISGFIIDATSKKPLVGVNVYLKNTSIGTATDDAGFYKIENIPLGQYQICVEMIGYEKPPVKYVKIIANQNIELNFELNVQVIDFQESVTITATRGHNLITEVPSSVDVIKMEDLEVRNPQNLAEALQNLQGVYIKDYGGLGNTKTISLRGSSSEQVLVMLDGQRLNNPQTGQVDLALIETEGIERIEVVRGGNSALYGSDAVGGVINIITKSPHSGLSKKSITGSIKYTIGSFNSLSFENGATFNLPFGILSGSYKLLESKGDFKYIDAYGNEQTRKNAGINSEDVYLKFNKPIGDSLFNRRLDITYKYYSSERGAPGTIEDLYKYAKNWDRANQYNLTFTGKVFNLFNDFRLQIYRHDSWNRYFNNEVAAYTDSRFTVSMDGAEAQMKTILIPQASLTYGLGLRSDKMDNLQLETSHNRLSWYGFIVNESNFNLSSRLIHTIFLVSSLRFDQTSNYGNKFSPKLGTVFNFGKYWQTSLKFNIGTSYRAPTFNDLYWPADAWTQGNPDLKPESGWDYDCGLRFQFPILNGLYWESTYFQNQMKGLIIWKEKNGIWSPENVNKAMIRGIENSLSFKPFKKFLEISGNYTFLDARNKTNERTVFNKRLVYRPKNTANINLNCSFSVFTLSYQFSYTGLRYTTNDNTDYLPSYKTSDITLNYKPKTDSADLLLSLQIKNIFDERYEIVKNMPIPGRELRLALKIGY